METTLDLTADIIDIRDIIERIEELPDLIEGDGCEEQCNSYREELATLVGIMSELAGCGGDEQWQGDWYPVTLISDSYFVDAMRELVQDIGDLPRDIPAYLAIDWEATANNLRADYSSVDIGELTYWYR